MNITLFGAVTPTYAQRPLPAFQDMPQSEWDLDMSDPSYKTMPQADFDAILKSATDDRMMSVQAAAIPGYVAAQQQMSKAMVVSDKLHLQEAYAASHPAAKSSMMTYVALAALAFLAFKK